MIECRALGPVDRDSKPPVVERRTFGRSDRGSKPPADVLNPGLVFRNIH